MFAICQFDFSFVISNLEVILIYIKMKKKKSNEKGLLSVYKTEKGKCKCCTNDEISQESEALMRHIKIIKRHLKDLSSIKNISCNIYIGNKE